MKTLLIALAVALAAAGCNRDNPAAGGSAAKKAPAPQGSMETPKGAATGQASEGSTDSKSAPQRPSSK